MRPVKYKIFFPFLTGILAIAIICLQFGLVRPLVPVHADAPPAAPSMSIDCDTNTVGDIQSSRTITNGTVFDIDLWIELPSGFVSAGGGAQITWDPTILSCTKVTVGDAEPYLFPVPPFNFTPAPDLSVPGQTNYFSITAFGSDVTGGGVMARYTFQAISNGTTTISIPSSGGSLSDNTGEHPIDFTAINVQNGSITVGSGEPMPDLAITTLAATWIDGSTGNYTINYTVTNQGDAEAVSSQMELYTDNATQASASETVPVLAAGASYQGSFNELVIALTDTTDTLTLKCDSANVVEESNENNNTTVYIWPQMVDLVLTNIVTQTVDAGQKTYKVNYVIKNQGSLAASTFKIGAFVDGATTPTVTETVSQLGIGATLEGNFQDHVFTVSGESDIIAINVDFENSIVEASEGNNTGSVADPFEGAGVAVNCTVAAGVLISFSVDDGSVDYGNIEFGYYRSSVELWDTQTITNTGEVTIDIAVKSSDAIREGGTNWVLADDPETDAFRHQIKQSFSSEWINMKPNYQPFISGVKPEESKDFDLRLWMPTYSVDPNTHNVRVSLQASVHE